MAWPTIDETKPVGTDKVKSIDDAERETRTFMINALAEISNFTKSGTQPALKTTRWTTATRPTGADLDDGVTGFNIDLRCEEYYDLATTTWEAKSLAVGSDTAENISIVPTAPVTGTNIQDVINQIMTLCVPAGAVMSFARNTAPTGWLKCNGTAVSRTTYATLFEAIGTTFGAGDGSTTFNLPDLRGEFVRGWDDSKGVDSGRTFGSSQDDAFEAHYHISGTYEGGSPYSLYGLTTVTSGYRRGEQSSSSTSPNTSTVGDTETRPRNIALLYCIKY